MCELAQIIIISHHLNKDLDLELWQRCCSFSWVHLFSLWSPITASSCSSTLEPLPCSRQSTT